MLIKHLSSIHQVPTSHFCGLKQVLLSNEETNSKITQIAITQLKQGETAEEHCHPDMEEFFFILDGVMRIKVDNKSYDCVRGDFIILNSATHIVRNKFKILSNNILTSILPCQKIHLT